MKKNLILLIVLTLSLSAKDITQIGNLMWEGGANHKSVQKQWLTDANYNAKKYMDTLGDTATTYCKSWFLLKPNG